MSTWFMNEPISLAPRSIGVCPAMFCTESCMYICCHIGKGSDVLKYGLYLEAGAPSRGSPAASSIWTAQEWCPGQEWQVGLGHVLTLYPVVPPPHTWLPSPLWILPDLQKNCQRGTHCSLKRKSILNEKNKKKDLYVFKGWAEESLYFAEKKNVCRFNYKVP